MSLYPWLQVSLVHDNEPVNRHAGKIIKIGTAEKYFIILSIPYTWRGLVCSMPTLQPMIIGILSSMICFPWRYICSWNAYAWPMIWTSSSLKVRRTTHYMRRHGCCVEAPAVTPPAEICRRQLQGRWGSNYAIIVTPAAACIVRNLHKITENYRAARWYFLFHYPTIEKRSILFEGESGSENQLWSSSGRFDIKDGCV